jgi:hypothetical protein
MKHLHRWIPQEPPALATDGLGAYREALLETWGTVTEWCGQGRPPTRPQPGKTWKYLQIVKKREGGVVKSVTSKIVYGNLKEGKASIGEHTAYVERTHLTSCHMNGRVVRTTLSFSKERRLLEVSCAFEDALYNCTRPVRTLRVEREYPTPQARWQPRTPAMAVGLTDHVWTVKELLASMLVSQRANR